MIRKKSKYSWPRTLFNKPRIEEENKIIAEYGLKKKREIWKTQAKVDYFRKRAKDLSESSEEEQQVLFDKLKEIGLNVNSIPEVLSLSIKDLLARRLSQVLVSKGIANTPKQARQMITHKRIRINGRAIQSPSYLVKVSEEGHIQLKHSEKKASKTEEASE